MNIDIKAEDVITEMQNQFPKEFTICVQAIQIRKLQEQLPAEAPSDAD